MAQKYPYIDDSHNPTSNPFHSLLNDYDQFGVAASSDFHISGISTFSGTSTFAANVHVKSGLQDATGDLGDSGQILSSTGSGINWINANTTSVANASNVGTNLNSTDASQFISFLGANSGNNPIRVDTDLTYNPSTNVLSVPSITMSSHLNIDGNIRSVAGNLELQAVTGENGVVIKDNNAVELYFDGSATYKLATTDTGVDVRGELESDTLKVTGNSALQGDVDLGTNADNTITFNGDIDSALIPKTTQSHSLGANGAEWDNLWVQDIKVSGSITDKDSSTGSSGQVLSSTGSQVDWINVGDISAGSASQVAITDNSADASQFINFTSAKSGNNGIRANDSLRYNPSTGALTATTFSGALSGNASSATVATNAQGLTGTPSISITGLTISGSITDKDSSTGTSGQVLSSTGSQVDWINIGDLSAGSASQVAISDNSTDASQFVNFTSAKSGNNAVRANDSLRYNPSNGTLSSTTFSGALSGNASSATVATNAQGLTGTPSISITGLTISGSITDKDSSTGTSGQVLSSTGSQVDWINVGDISAGSASQVSVSDDSNADAARFVTFVDSSSGNNAVKSDGQLKYNPSTNELTAGSFNGSMAASNIDSGTFSADRVPSLASSKITSGTLGTGRIPDLAASKITSGTLGTDRIPDLAASKITSGTLTDARIPSLNASKINAGTFADARIPSLAASKITSGTFATARIPDLAASKITSGTISDSRLPSLISSDIIGNATTASAAYVTESNTDTINRGLVFCDAANNASGNKDLKYDRNLVYNANSNTLYANNVQGTLGNFTNVDGAVKVRTDAGNAWHQVLFVDSSTDNQYQTLKMDDETSRLAWNPSTETLVAQAVASYRLLDWGSSYGSSGQVLTSKGSSQWAWETIAAMTGNSKITVKTSGSGTHTTQSWCRTVVALAVGGGGGGGNAWYSYDDDDGTSQGRGGSGGAGGHKYYTASVSGSTGISYSIGSGGCGQCSGSCDDNIANGASGGSTTFGNVTAGGGGGGSGTFYGTGANGADGSGDAIFFQTAYGAGGGGATGRSGDGCQGNAGAGTGGAVFILELG